MAVVAIAEGGRLRRRRRWVAGGGVAAGLVAVMGGAAGLSLLAGRGDQPAPPVTLAAAMMPVSAPSCLPEPVETGATDVAVFLGQQVSDQQRAAIRNELRKDPRVAAVVFETRREAWEKFRVRWKQSPDLVAAVTVEALPESFRLRLVAGTDYTAVRDEYGAMDGVRDMVGRRCSADAPIGGTL